MKRLVYNPRVEAYVKADSGIVDISPYITSCSITRKVNQVSTASVTFRNPTYVNSDGDEKKLFTDHEYTAPDGTKSIEPMFHPMDPIIITLTRLRDRPVQVFTGYCDKTPYLQLFPGPCTIEASCTLKRLQYTYWDPGLPFVAEFMQSFGWALDLSTGSMTSGHDNPSGKKVKPGDQKLTDGSFGALLGGALEEIGGWDKSIIHIDELPPQIVTVVTNLFQDIKATSEASQKDFEGLLHKIIGTASISGGGSGDSSGTGAGGPSHVGGGGWESCELTWYDPALGGTNSGSGAADPNSPTTSGEPYSPTAWTCAAPPTYSFGTMLAFRYGGKEVTCRVNDRGGAIQGAHFDLARKPAEYLGVISAGRVTAQFKRVK